MTFTLSVSYVDATGSVSTLHCGTTSNCKIVYQKNYSPILYYLSPPVVYQGSEVDCWFNPRNIMGLIKDRRPDYLPFINIKIGDANVDFEGFVDYETTFTT